MNISSIDAQKWLREPGAPTDSDRTPRSRRFDAGSVEPGSGRLRFLKFGLENSATYETTNDVGTPRHPEPWRLALMASWLRGPARLVSLASLFACAGVLTIASPAAAQDDPAAPAEESAEAAPDSAEGSAEAAPAAEGSSEATSAEVDAVMAAGDPDAIPDGYIEEVEDVAEVVVTGFRVSLGAALQKKQRATGQVDAIVAEDIADFPDLNLAESLQRIPGVAITRTYGEGAQITVRGLSGLYTRVRVNGMEARAAVGNNAGRNFDFNVFASELFNSIVVHKTATADLDEGSLGAVIDLNTARAFNYDEGFTFVAGANGVYNDLSNTVRPRLTALAAYRDPAGIWGATASIAYTKVRNDSASADTVRWQRGPFRSINGVVCMDNPMDPGCVDVNGAAGVAGSGAQHPRIPRYGEEVNRNNRLGMTGGIQFRPADSTEIRLDALYATYNQSNDRRWLETLFRGNEPQFDVTSYTLQPFPQRYGVGNNSLLAATVDNAWVRSERNPINLQSQFYQVTLAVDHRFNESFWLNALGGTTRSRGKLNDATVNYDMRNYNGFSYDYTNDQYPLLAYNGADVNNAGNYQVTELRDRYSRTTSTFDTAELDLHYDIIDQLKLSAGVNYKQSELDTRASNRDGLVCELGIFQCDTDGDGENDVFGPPGDAALTDQIEYPGKVGAGSNTRWAAPQVDGWFQRLNYDSVPLEQDQDGTYTVTEKNLGTFLMSKGEFALANEGEMRLMYDVGVRYVQTRQSSTGYNSGVLVTIDRPMYDDFLPSANVTFWPIEQFAIRAAAAQVMSRPALANLSPGGAVDSFNFAVNNQNPFLDPTRATALDASFEWYFGDASVLSLALFMKDVDSFPIRDTRTGTFASTGLPGSVIQGGSPAALSPNFEGTCGNPAGCWEISELTNGPGASLKGLEIGFQAPFNVLYGSLPPIIRSMGVVANYTLIASDVEYDLGALAAMDSPVTTITERLLGLSNRSANATLYYDDSTFGARLSLAHRSDYLLGGPNLTGNLWEFAQSETRLDFSSSYNLTENLRLTLEAVNLLNTPTATMVDVDAERRVLFNHTGRNILLGAQLKL
jgi:iron complex outermembrane receptor protein